MSDSQSYAVAIDSDGCVFDNMSLKHRQCFGPALIEVWQLDAVQPAVQAEWDRINLFSHSRGVNRFLALLEFWRTFPDADLPAGFERPDITRMEQLAHTHTSPSPDKIEAELARADDTFLKQALTWCEAVNRRVAALDTELPPFPSAARFIKKISAHADVHVVSSANRATIMAEWKEAGLDQHVSDYVTQERCSKAECLRQLTEAGHTVLTIGDSPGDWHAAQKSGVFFHPIIPGEEEKSWADLYHILDTNCPVELFKPHEEALVAFTRKLGLA